MAIIAWPKTGFELITSKEDSISRFHSWILLSKVPREKEKIHIYYVGFTEKKANAASKL